MTTKDKILRAAEFAEKHWIKTFLIDNNGRISICDYGINLNHVIDSEKEFAWKRVRKPGEAWWDLQGTKDDFVVESRMFAKVENGNENLQGMIVEDLPV